MKPKSIIGRQYVPFDNSYSVNLTKQSDINGKLKCDYLAGGEGKAAQCVTVKRNAFYFGNR